VSANTIGPVETAVLQQLRQKEYRPLELLQLLSDSGYASSDLKLALALLLHDGHVQLTSDRILRETVAA
jgi:hypothetical protein